jgi:hypothetical protein
VTNDEEKEMNVTHDGQQGGRRRLRAPTRRRVVAVAATAMALIGAGTALAASPVRGSIAGPVTSAKGQVFVVETAQSPSGSANVHVSSKTEISQQTSATVADLKKGSCAMAVGQRTSKNVVAASRITLTQPVSGRCGARFGRPRAAQGQSPTTPPPGSARNLPANLGISFGTIAAVKGSTLTLHGRLGTSTVTVSTKTEIMRTSRVDSSAIKPKLCAFVFGTSSDKGITVSADSVNLFEPTANGCTTGFRRP